MTIGLIFITAASLNAVFGPNLFTARLPSYLDASVDLGFRQIQVYRLAVVAAGIVVIAVLWLVFDRTSFGAKLRAAVDNRTMTEATGVNVKRLLFYHVCDRQWTCGAGRRNRLSDAATRTALSFQISNTDPDCRDVIGFWTIAHRSDRCIDSWGGGHCRPLSAAEFGRVLHLHFADRLAAVAPRRIVFRPGIVMTIPQSSLLNQGRLKVGEIIFWMLPAVIYFVFPDRLSLATSALIMSLFALSFDLLLGYAGVVTLGHALFFGIGAYVAGLIALAGYIEPIGGVVAAGAFAALAAAVLGPVLLRLRGLAFMMVTLGVGVLTFEAANKATWLTGGDDGLQGIELAPLLGLFRWSVYGHTGFWYVLLWLFLCFLVARRVVNSPYGIALRGIRENPDRMKLIGTPVLGRLVRLYALSAGMAGIAGALSAQTSRFVGLEVFSIDMSINALLMVVLGGSGHLYGALIGAPVYVVVKDLAAGWNPYSWMFVIGFLLVFVVRFGQHGLLGLAKVALEASPWFKRGEPR